MPLSLPHAMLCASQVEPCRRSLTSPSFPKSTSLLFVCYANFLYSHPSRIHDLTIYCQIPAQGGCLIYFAYAGASGSHRTAHKEGARPPPLRTKVRPFTLLCAMLSRAGAAFTYYRGHAPMILRRPSHLRDQITQEYPQISRHTSATEDTISCG